MTTSRRAWEVHLTGWLTRRAQRLILPACQKGRQDQLRVLPVRPGALVMLGDSLIEQGEWAELLPGRLIANRGISGETSRQLLLRVDRSVGSAQTVMVLIGTNDLSAGVRPGNIAANVGRILDRVALRAPEASVLLHGVMPRRARFATEIRHLNRRLNDVASVRGAAFLDMWPILSDGDGALRTEYSSDSLHLNGAGYLAWARALEGALDGFPGAPVQ